MCVNSVCKAHTLKCLLMCYCGCYFFAPVIKHDRVALCAGECISYWRHVLSNETGIYSRQLQIHDKFLWHLFIIFCPNILWAQPTESPISMFERACLLSAMFWTILGSENRHIDRFYLISSTNGMELYKCFVGRRTLHHMSIGQLQIVCTLNDSRRDKISIISIVYFSHSYAYTCEYMPIQHCFTMVFNWGAWCALMIVIKQLW